MTRPIAVTVLALALTGISSGWREVEMPRSLALTGNYTGALRVGDVVELVCSSSGVLPYSTLAWTRQEGNVQLNTWTRGYSPLALALRVTPDLNGVQFYCSAPFSEEVEGYYFPYSVISETVQLTVAGAGAPQESYLPGHVEMAGSGGGTHRVGDIVLYTCTTHDIPFAVVDVIQAKGKYEVQLHTGWQPWRQVRVNMTAADDGSALYCRVRAADPDDYRQLYTLVSNRVPVRVIAN